MYKSFVRSNLEYAEVVWDGCLKRESDLIESVQFDAARLITGYMKGTHRESLLIYTGLHMRSVRRKIHKLILLYKMVNGQVPDYLSTLFPSYVLQRTAYALRTGSNLCLPFVTTENRKMLFFFRY